MESGEEAETLAETDADAAPVSRAKRRDAMERPVMLAAGLTSFRCDPLRVDVVFPAKLLGLPCGNMIYLLFACDWMLDGAGPVILPVAEPFLN